MLDHMWSDADDAVLDSLVTMETCVTSPTEVFYTSDDMLDLGSTGTLSPTLMSPDTSSLTTLSPMALSLGSLSPPPCSPSSTVPPPPHSPMPIHRPRTPTAQHSPDSTSPKNNKAAPGTPILPPCAICGERASGFHYGANTCEACKGFFRRCLVRKTEHKCNHKTYCATIPGRRHACPACRYKRCIAAGMSKDAIKTGRYTLEKKTRDIETLKRLELQDKIKDDGGLMSSQEDRQKELDKIIQRLTDVHMAHVGVTKDIFATMHEREAQFMAQREKDKEMFGTMGPLPYVEYKMIYDLTGLDIDGRKDLISRMVPTIDRVVVDFVRFAKALPGFTDLPTADQMRLLKDSFMDRWVFLFNNLYNTDKHICTYVYDMHVMFTFDDCLKFADQGREKEILQMWDIMKRAQQLDLTPEESVIAAALCLMNADAELSRVGRLITSASSDYLVEALEYLIQKNHDPEDLVVARIASIMADLRTYRHVHKEFQLNFLRDGEGLGIPEVVVEMMKD